MPELLVEIVIGPAWMLFIYRKAFEQTTAVQCSNNKLQQIQRVVECNTAMHYAPC